FGLATVLGDDDGQGWGQGAVLADQWGRQHLGLLDVPLAMGDAFSRQNKGYHYLLGGFFTLTGTPARLPAAALNCLFGALAVVLIYRTARCLFSRWASVRVGWWACLFPSLIVWSAMTIKEPIVILLESVAIYTCLRMHAVGPAPRYLLLCIASFILLLPFRFY